MSHVVLRTARRCLLAGCTGLVALAVGGAIYQVVATGIDDRRYPPLGDMVDVGGLGLHAICRGVGEPVVVMDAGLGGTSLTWRRVQPEVAKFARTCAFDRAGLGWSDAGPSPRTSVRFVAELRTLLQHLEVPGPYVLVGHSFGGATVRLYANLYPAEVAGLVLVDSAHEEHDERLHAIGVGIPRTRDLMYRALPLAAHTGVARVLLPFVRGRHELETLAEERMDRALESRSRHLLTTSREYAGWTQSMAEVKAAAGDLGDMPLVVLSHGNRVQSESVEGLHGAIHRVWWRLQEDLVSRSRRSRWIWAERSGHSIQLDQPELVVEAIREVVNQARAPGGALHRR